LSAVKSRIVPLQKSLKLVVPDEEAAENANGEAAANGHAHV
jgi:hypothetical protein